MQTIVTFANIQMLIWLLFCNIIHNNNNNHVDFPPSRSAQHNGKKKKLKKWTEQELNCRQEINLLLKIHEIESEVESVKSFNEENESNEI